MTALNLLLRRMNQWLADPESGYLEDASTAALVGLLAFVTLTIMLL
jgi:hypothetical protein